MLDIADQVHPPNENHGTAKRGAVSLPHINRIFAGSTPAVDGIDLNIEARKFFYPALVVWLWQNSIVANERRVCNAR